MYLDMVSALETAVQIGFLPEAGFDPRKMDQMVSSYQRLGIGLNELSRTMGLLDMVPEVFVAPVVKKMQLVHASCMDVASRR